MSDRTHTVVIGGTSGIGRHFAQSCAERGDDVVITGRSEDRTKGVADEIGGRTRGLALDLAEPERIVAALAEVERVDHLVLAALDRDYNTVREYRPADATRLLTVKLTGYTDGPARARSEDDRRERGRAARRPCQPPALSGLHDRDDRQRRHQRAGQDAGGGALADPGQRPAPEHRRRHALLE